MEEFLDVKIAKDQRRLKESQYRSVESGVYVKHRLVEFEAVELFEKKLRIFLPKGFQRMSEEMAKLKYPSEKRPQRIFSNEAGSVNFTFSHFAMEIEPEETMEAVQQFQQVIKRLHPANIFYELQEEVIGEPGKETKLSWFDFKGYAIDSQTYTIMYVTPLAKTLLHGIFNCAFSDAAEWKKAALTAIKSIADLTKKRKDELG